MRLRLPSNLEYPVTVTELLKQPGDAVSNGDKVLRFDFKSRVERKDSPGQTTWIEKIFPSNFESELEGNLGEWLVRPGQYITGPVDVAEIVEECTHEVQFHGICAICGKDMTQLNYNTQTKDTARAAINMVHDDVNLKISTSEATRAEEEAKKRLITSKRLSLVVDLDQTIIHATVDPTVGEWKQDPDNPNYAAVVDVQAFQLTDDGPGGRACWYYIKQRPGLQTFLRNISRLYELHIYTMGTRAYAQQIAKIVDPDRSIFADRILSRDESGSLIAKNLQRLFPVDTKMVVIIDDRGDVWKWNDNLVKVTPYDFFVGIGDINSSFLPQKPKMQATPKAVVTTEARPEAIDGAQNAVGDENTSSALDQLVSMAGGNDPEKLKDQTEKAAQAIDSQLEERPLLQKQKALDKAEDEVGSQSPSSIESDSSEKHRHHLLEDHDTELDFLEASLTQVHKEFYGQYESRLPADDQSKARAVTSISDGKEEHRPPAPVPNLDALPDIKQVMPEIKKRVLSGVSLVFSGVVPLGVDVQNSDIAVWAKSFGAKVRTEISTRRTTHVVAARKGTSKVKQALRSGKGKIKVVGTQWLMDSIVRWKRQDETPYLLHSEEDEVLPADPRTGIEEDEAGTLSESEEPDDGGFGTTDGEMTDVEVEGRKVINKLHLRTKGLVKANGELQQNVEKGELDAASLAPDPSFDEASPIGKPEDWQDIEDELADYLDDVTDDESETDPPLARDTDVAAADQNGLPGQQLESSRKRPSDDDNDGQSGNEENDEDRPPRKRAREDVSDNDREQAQEPDDADDQDDDGFDADFAKAWEESEDEAT